MRYLLPAIRETVQALPLLPRRSDCYITPSTNWMPTGTRQPCIGIKDGGITRAEQSCGVVELTMRVELACFVLMALEGETPMCGDKGVFLLADEAMALLLAVPALDGQQGIELGPDRPVELFQADNNQFLIKLVRTMIYTVQR